MAFSRILKILKILSGCFLFLPLRSNLGIFGELLPLVGFKNGIISSDVKISGTFDDVKYAGKFELIDGLFRMKKNNLYYNANALLNLEKQQIKITKFVVSNHGGVKKSGTIKSLNTALEAAVISGMS